MDFSKIELMPLVVLGCLAVGFVIKNTNILKDKYNQFIPFRYINLMVDTR